MSARRRSKRTSAVTKGRLLEEKLEKRRIESQERAEKARLKQIQNSTEEEAANSENLAIENQLAENPCDKDKSGRCLPDQSGTSYFHSCPRLVWAVLAILVWQLIFSLLPQTSLGSACQTSLGPHIFTTTPD